MENWDAMQTNVNYVEQNNWYNNMFAANIKTEPGTASPPPTPQTQQNTAVPSSDSCNTQLENYLKYQQNHQQQFSAMDTNISDMTPSPSNGEQQQQTQQQLINTTGMHQQLMQQQQFQQHFQQAQQAAAQNQVSTHLPLGLNPLTPPGLPQAVLPAVSHFYNQSTQQQQQTTCQQTVLENSVKLVLTPRLTPPMDTTPPKSPKPSDTGNLNEQKEDQELMSNSSEEQKYIADSDDDESIRMPIYNSHGKIKHHKCKTCGKVDITKLGFWQHAQVHMKPEKILHCPKCPFVTELKHHLVYHIHKHKNLKPFQCDKCSYTCVNKSMLNSHRKSHSSVYQYRCADCDYATKYCHSFKLHLRKYDHKPGLVLDEEGVPNPSVVIDVYGTRRGPKNKGSSGSGSMKKGHSDLKLSTTSKLSAALRGFPHNSQNQIPDSPAKNITSVASDLPALTLNMSLQQQQQQLQQSAAAQISPSQQSQASSQNGTIPNLLPPLASLLQQNHNMAFFPYWNLNLHMLAAQQQAAVLAQLSPRLREQLQKHQHGQNAEKEHIKDTEEFEGDEDDDGEQEEEENDLETNLKKVGNSAMDLSQGTPTKDDQQQQTPESAINLKLAEHNEETPLFASSTAARRKGRVLKLDPEQLKTKETNPGSPSLQDIAESEMHTDSSSITAPASPAAQASANKNGDNSTADESMDASHTNLNNPSNSSSNTIASSANSSNSSSTVSSSANSTTNASPPATPTMYECKYCDIFFKDAVLYTIHMGYHSCDDVFKCNMCGEKCDGPVGLFVHMARNAHS